jgi:precorrin-6B methylase 2
MFFDAHTLFPLLKSSQYSYEDAKKHAAAVDDFLQIPVAATEQRIQAQSNYQNSPHQCWLNLPEQTLQTTYLEIRELLSHLNLVPGDHLVDLGCAYGRIGLVMHEHYPECHFTGYDVVEERLSTGREALRRIGARHQHLLQQNIIASDFQLPDAQFYFMYEFGLKSAIENILGQLREQAKKRAIQVVIRGQQSRLIAHEQHPWLTEVNEPLHFPLASIYRS